MKTTKTKTYCICETPNRQKSGCTCKKGYVRHDGYCMEEKECRKVECNQNPNEKFYSCFGSSCGPEECSNLVGPQIICGMPPFCVPGCSCEHGFSRNEEGKCIPNNSCGRCSDSSDHFGSIIVEEPMVGAFEPQCTKNHKDKWFQNIQSYGSTGYRWCAIVPRYSYLPVDPSFEFSPSVKSGRRKIWKKFCQKNEEIGEKLVICT